VKTHSKASRQSAHQTSAYVTDMTDLTVAAAPAMTDRAQKRQLERTVAWTTRERLRCLWYRLRLEISDYDYAARRVIELQMRLPEGYVRPGVPTPNRPADSPND
jgi:hypothetical protein